MAKKKKKPAGGANPFPGLFRKKGPPLMKAEIVGKGEAWVDPGLIREAEYDPEVIKIGGAESFARFVHQCLVLKGIGDSPENNYEWDVRTNNKFWFDPRDPDNFPLKEPGPGRVQVPMYLFMITRVRGKPFEWACCAEVEDVLRGCHWKYFSIWAEDYCRQIQTGILDRLTPPKTEDGPPR